MSVYLWVIVALLALANIVSGIASVLQVQEVLTLLSITVCMLMATTAAESRVNPVSLMAFTSIVFLLGRFLSSFVFGHGDYRHADWFLDGEIAEATMATVLAANTLFICGVVLGSGKLKPITHLSDASLRRWAVMLAFLLLPFALYRGYIHINFWQQGEYLNLYLAGAPTGFAYTLGGWFIIAIFALLASKPSRLGAFVALGVGVAFCIAETLKGTRGIALAEAVVLFWIFARTQRIKLSLLKIIPAGLILIIFADYIGRARFSDVDTAWIVSGFGEAVLDFLFSQGTTLLFIVSTYINLSHFTPVDAIQATFALPVDTVHNFFSSLPQHQTADYALATASLPHRIAYMVNPEMYLAGNGMGGSAVAESLLYAPLVGPLFAGAFCGLIIRHLARWASNTPSGLFILVGTLPFILLIPRENMFYFGVPFLKACCFLIVIKVLVTQYEKRSSRNYCSSSNLQTRALAHGDHSYIHTE